MADQDRLPPLPPPLRREAVRLRSLAPSEDFADSLRAALTRAEAEQESARAARRHGPLLRWAQMAALLVPVLIGAILVMHLGLPGGRDGQEADYLERFESVDVILGEQGPSWFHIDLSTHHHKGSNATVHVETHQDLSVVPSVHVVREQTPPDCNQGTCVYRFDHPATHTEQPDLQIGVRAPGHYRIRVEHVSQDARVREEILVRARHSTVSE